MQQKIANYAEMDGGRIYYEVAGQGQPLVLAHAGFLDSRMWDDQWEALAQHYRVIRFDLRGYGQSDSIDAPVAYRRDLHHLLRHLEIPRAHLVGCSLSGEMVLDFALEYPEMVSALVVVSAVPGGFEMQGEPPRYLMEMIGAVQAGDLERASELQVRIWVDGSFREPEQVSPAVRQHAAHINQDNLSRGTWAVTSMMPPADPLQPPAVTRLGDIAAPTLVIAGALDHPEILRAADVLADGIAQARRVIVPDSAHVPNMEQPEAFNRAVIDFLQQAAS